MEDLYLFFPQIIFKTEQNTIFKGTVYRIESWVHGTVSRIRFPFLDLRGRYSLFYGETDRTNQAVSVTGGPL